MVWCTLTDLHFFYRNDFKMFKPQVEPLGVGKWFHCKVLNILLSFLHCMVDKRIDHTKLLSIFVFAITLIVFNTHFHCSQCCGKSHA